MTRTLSILVASGAALLGAAVAAQQTPPPSFTAATRTVAVYATVTNAPSSSMLLISGRSDQGFNSPRTPD